jgi:hypothetical protein
LCAVHKNDRAATFDVGGTHRQIFDETAFDIPAYLRPRDFTCHQLPEGWDIEQHPQRDVFAGQKP